MSLAPGWASTPQPELCGTWSLESVTADEVPSISTVFGWVVVAVPVWVETSMPLSKLMWAAPVRLSAVWPRPYASNPEKERYWAPETVIAVEVGDWTSTSVGPNPDGAGA